MDYYTYKFYGSYNDEVVYVSHSNCYVIVTCKSILWTILTLLSTLLVVGSITTPQWLVGKTQWIGTPPKNLNGTLKDNEHLTYRPTIGLFNWCPEMHKFGDFSLDKCVTYVTGFDMSSDDFPNWWKSGLIFMTVAIALLGFTNITAIISVCCQSIFKKSIFTVSGLIQSISGLFLIIGMVLYPVGWGSKRVKTLCGNSEPFVLGGCDFGWAFYTCAAGIFLVMICAILSIQAETATSSDKVEQEIIKGKNIVCVP